MRFHEATALTEEYLPTAQREVRTYVLRSFVRPRLLSPEGTGQMRQGEHGGGVDAKVRIEARDWK